MKRFVAALLMAFSPLVFSADYKFDTAHTQILFKVSHLGFSTSTGAFTEFDGGFAFDPAAMEKSSVDVTIKTASLDMNNATWNQHLSGDKWFDIGKYPTMTFKSTKVTKTGDKTMDVMGDLTIKGVTKPVTLKVTFNKAGNQFGKEKAGFDAMTTIDRTAFGMDTYAGAVGNEVEIHIAVEGEMQ